MDKTRKNTKGNIVSKQMIIKESDLKINWNQKPSFLKIAQVNILINIINHLKPERFIQHRPLSNFKKQCFSVKFNEDFFLDTDSSDITLVSKGKTLDLFFNRVLSITTGGSDYCPPANLIILKDKRISIITTSSDFSNKKLRRKFVGYKYLDKKNQSIFVGHDFVGENYKKFYVGPLLKKDEGLLRNNGFQITQITSLKIK